jgi:hypothetical protein
LRKNKEGQNFMEGNWGGGTSNFEGGEGTSCAECFKWKASRRILFLPFFRTCPSSTNVLKSRSSIKLEIEQDSLKFCSFFCDFFSQFSFFFFSQILHPREKLFLRYIALLDSKKRTKLFFFPQTFLSYPLAFIKSKTHLTFTKVKPTFRLLRDILRKVFFKTPAGTFRSEIFKHCFLIATRRFQRKKFRNMGGRKCKECMLKAVWEACLPLSMSFCEAALTLTH